MKLQQALFKEIFAKPIHLKLTSSRVFGRRGDPQNVRRLPHYTHYIRSIRNDTRFCKDLFKIFGILILMGFLSSNSVAQPDSAKIQKVYEQFSQAHEELDLSLMESVYAEDAYYLNSNAEEGIEKGRANIVEGFSGLFENAQERGTSLKMIFKIINRDITDDLAYDIGYYKLEATPREGNVFESAGKFMTVLKRNQNGSWKIVADAFSKTPLEAFEKTD